MAVRVRQCAAVLLGLALLAGCGSSNSGVGAADASIRDHLLRGVAEIRRTHDRKELHGKLTRTLAALRRDRASTESGRQARTLAIQGFASTLKGIRSELDFAENDSGNVEAATRDAKRAYFYLTRGAKRLRAAGHILGLRIGKLNQH